ncbi:MAG: hypothetical protein KatS3mg084_0164 [Candidatus Dojkabacteria bacterium]|nr:MAG: hypothetical protein KatS3mg084_0164 [Candidatus Dojkabacteria bacterium]
MLNFRQYYSVAIHYFFVIVLLAVISFTVYYYLFVFRTRELFPNILNEVNIERYKEAGFKKVEKNSNDGSQVYFFVPSEWVVIDNALEAYGDVLSGSNAYLRPYPNSLGRLTPVLCDEFGVSVYDALKRTDLYRNTQLIDKSMQKVGNYDACVLNYEVEIDLKKYLIRQVFFFHKYRIYQLFVQLYENLPYRNEIMHLITDSVFIKDY